MNIPRDIENDFYNGKRSQTLPFIINDTVRIVSEEYKDELAAVISITSDTKYLVELSNGDSITVESEYLELVE